MSGNNNDSSEFSKRYNNIESLLEDDERLSKLSVAELKSVLTELKEAEKEYKNLELIVKRDANSLYGTTGSEYFSLGDFDSAEDITQTGRFYAVLVDREINNFFVNWDETEWKIVKTFYPEAKPRKFTEYRADTANDICVYGDTDSRYLDFGKIYELININIPPNTEEGNKSLSDFAIFMMDNFINGIIKTCIDEDITYRKANHGRLKMAHEVTTRISILQAKKKYAMNTIWEDGKFLIENTLVYKGVELKKGELNPRIKKIIQTLLEKFIQERSDEEEIRLEILKIIKHIRKLNNKDYIYRSSSVSGIFNAYLDNKVWKSEKNHIQIQIVLSWLNFIETNNLHNEYKPPFEGQKMYFYYDVNGKVFGVPDDVELNSVKGVPEPDYYRMLKDILVKPLLKYIKEYNEINPKHIENFLLGVKEFSI